MIHIKRQICLGRFRPHTPLHQRTRAQNECNKNWSRRILKTLINDVQSTYQIMWYASILSLEVIVAKIDLCVQCAWSRVHHNILCLSGVACKRVFCEVIPSLKASDFENRRLKVIASLQIVNVTNALLLACNYCNDILLFMYSCAIIVQFCLATWFYFGI